MLATAALTIVLGVCIALADAQQPVGCQCTASGIATYEFKFTSTWSSPTPPTSFPHWSSPVGTSHSPCYTMWRPGSTASTGIEQMAEFGGTGSLTTEFSSNRPQTLSAFTASGISSATGSTSTTFTVDRYHPLVSVTSMIAPSPDWFIGEYSQNLCNGSAWRQKATYDLSLWDAGTDSGLTWTAANSDTSPKQVIALLSPSSNRATSLGFATGTTKYSLGTITFTRTSTDQSGAVSNPNCAMCATTLTTTVAPTTLTTTVAPTTPTPTMASRSSASSTTASSTNASAATSVAGATTQPTTVASTTEERSACKCKGAPMYRMTFNTKWTSPTPPSNFPHWSPPIGATHSPCFTMWRTGALASDGIKNVAEFGTTSTLSGEISAAAPQTLTRILTQSISTASGMSSGTFTTDTYHPLVSVVSMIAPSPDWFVGVDSVSLCDGTRWSQSVTVPLNLYDAGTDSGQTWTASNAATNPRQPIARLVRGSPRASVFSSYDGSGFGTVTFELLSSQQSTDGRFDGTNPGCTACDTFRSPVDATNLPNTTSSAASLLSSMLLTIAMLAAVALC